MATPVPVPMENIKLGFVGAGKMAESIAKGVVKSGVLPASRIRTAVHKDISRLDAFSSLGVKVFDRNQQVVEESNVVVLSVKPQIGILHTFCFMEDWAGHGRVIRVVPNTPAAVSQAVTVISLGKSVMEEDAELIASLFGAIGKIWRADEKYLDAVTGLSGSGPAYIYLAIDALADGGVAAGLPRDLALGLASQTVLGAAAMAINSGGHPGQLKDDVASPGGTTIAGIHELEKGGFRGVLMNAVIAAANRSRELSNR